MNTANIPNRMNTASSASRATTASNANNSSKTGVLNKANISDKTNVPNKTNVSDESGKPNNAGRANRPNKPSRANKEKIKEIFRIQRIIILAMAGVILLLIIIFSAINSSARNRRAQAEEQIEQLYATIEELRREEIPPDIPWNLQLINENHPLPEDFEPTLTEIDPYFVAYSRVVENFINMRNEAESEGIFLNIGAAYLSFDRQRELFVGRMSELTGQYNLFDAYHQAANSVFIPGTSEHQAGLAISFRASTNAPYGQDFADSPEVEWLTANAHRFGFVRRFPLEKVEVTGVDFAPFQWRFVGIEEATTMHQQGLVLEEFLQREFDIELN